MIDDLRPYPEYKKSNLPWLSKIPVHWRVVRNGSLFAQRNQTGFAHLPILEVSLKTGVRVRVFENSKRKQVMSDLRKYKRAAKGDLAYNMMRMWQGAVGVAPVDGLVSPAYVVARPFTEVVARYYSYLFRTDVYMFEVDAYSRGIVKDRNRLYWDQFKQMVSPAPRPHEQVAIVRFLDDANRRIERYVREKRKLIALLNEQKQAIIHRAVTRGFEPDVRLKSSGIPWLGEIPEHWKVAKLYRITDPLRPIMYGIVLPGPNVDKGVFIVKGGNCETGRLRPEFLSRTTFAIESKYARSRLRENDIVYSIRGSIGSAQIVPAELIGANLTQDAARVAPDRGIYPQWLLFAVRSRSFFEKLDAGAVGATIRGINIRDLKRADIVIPSFEEQVSIAEFLSRDTERFETAISQSERGIAFMREYQTRLVADVVTGVLDVRAVAEKLPKESREEDVELLEESTGDEDEPSEFEDVASSGTIG
jgi:type I restriction enzyme, S subunit